MQIFLRCGGEVGTIVLDVSAKDSVGQLKHTLGSRGARLPSAHQLWLQYQGRSLADQTTLAQAGIRSASTVDVHCRLRGGGGDGGSTGAESRSSYLEMYLEKKPDKVNPAEEKLARWTSCQLSGEPLQPPCVSDELGNMFNKDAVITALVSKTLPKSLSHISSLRHLIDLKLERNPHYKPGASSQATFQPGNEAAFCCPITGQECNGRFRFVLLRNTGHVISERALKQVPSAVEEHIGQQWTPADVLVLNPTAEEAEQMREQLLQKRAAAKASKKTGKHGVKNGATAAEDLVIAANAAKARSQPTSAAAVADIVASAAELAHAAHAAHNGKRSAEQAALDGKAKAKKFKAPETAPKYASKDVYASIFTSSRPQEKETYSCRSTSARGMNMV
ncbi:hypothetical protein WJX72_006506 [[Myrmecia] bisecta]|uniref:Ubiquitin-like domain-containing protein n=1 Tax=[Myrmecia] bisecta TaxID=41462 RepID=A0AAW1Q1A3_9CHLO